MMLNGKLIIDELLIILFVFYSFSFPCGGKDDKRQWSEGFGH